MSNCAPRWTSSATTRCRRFPAPEVAKKISETYNKPLWNTEEHVYKNGFDCEISLVEAFNDNYIRSGITKIINWYLVGSVYPMEPYPEQPAAMMANSPWSGHYYTRPVLWGYAHYGQFVKAGWQYLNGGCGNLTGGGTFVTVKSPETDYSVIAQTKGAKTNQTLTFKLSGGLSTGKVCVWRSNAAEQFVKQADITPVNGRLHHHTRAPVAVFNLDDHRPAEGIVRQCAGGQTISAAVLRHV